jgi:uncharacterized protein YbjT (DUF2867 family)
MAIKVILTGATGMVGEGVLHECLNHPGIEKVLIINRKPSGMAHQKLTEIVHADFFDMSPIRSSLKGYDACFFCLGVSSIGMKEPEFKKYTYDLTLHFATVVAETNPDLEFSYISGTGTDSSEKGRTMWARVKGKTENDLLRLFKRAYMFRPGYMHPTKGLKNTLKSYRYISWLYPVLKKVWPNKVSTLKELGLAMINIAINGYEKNIVSVADIKIAAKM